MKKILITMLFSGWLGYGMCQSIQRVEYFFDTDPGFGNGMSVPILTGSSVTANLNIPLAANLTNGFHKFFIRAQNANGVWSMVHSQNFFKTSSETVFNDDVVALEYFIDTDPGFGLANAISFSPGSSETVALSIPITNELPIGFHKFYIRAKDAYGKWSVVYSQNFYKTNELPALQNIVKLEYFFDADPGYGQGTAVTFTPGTSIDLQSQVFNIANSITIGQHKFYLRAQDASGKWSIVANETITVCEIGATISATPSLNSCGTAITLTANITNPTPNSLTWKWMKDGRFIGNDNQSNISVTASGNYNIQMTNGNSGTCEVVNSGIAEVNIKKTDTLVIFSDSKASICGSAVHLDIDASKSDLSDRFGFTYQWFRNEVPISILEKIDVTQGGRYKLKMNYLGGFSSCQATESNVLTVINKAPLLTIGPLSSEPSSIEVCQGSAIRLSAISDLHPFPALQWYKNNLPLAGETGSSLLVNNAAGAYQVEMTAGCPGVKSVKYDISYAAESTTPFSISLIEGQLSSCPGTIAKIGTSGCTGNIIWSNGVSENTLSIAQQNSARTYSANCSGTCLSSSSNTLTLSPSAPTLLAPIIEVEMLPVSQGYKDAKHPGFYSQYAFAYADYLPPVGTVPTANGDVFYSDHYYDLHIIKNNVEQSTQSSLLIKSESISATATDMILLQNDLFLTVGYSSAGIGLSKSQASFGGDDFWLLARDKDGTKVWDFTFGGNSTDKAIVALQNSKGDIFIFGETTSSQNGNKNSLAIGETDYLLFKTTSNGLLIGDLAYGGSGNDKLKDALLLSNGNLLMIGGSTSSVSGKKTSPPLGGEDIYLVCINEIGAIQWQKSLGGSESEYGISGLEKDGFIYIIGSNQKIYKLDLNGNEIRNGSVNFDLYPSSTSHFTDLHGIYKTPGNSILITSRLSGNATSNILNGPLTYGYDAFVIFEIDDTLAIIQETVDTYGSTTIDNLGKCFFDLQGDFHLIKDGAVFACPKTGDPIWWAYYLDQSADNSINCNSPSDNFYGWYQWIISPNKFEKRHFVDHCRNTEFLLRARSSNSVFEGQVDFLWSTGDTTAFIKFKPENRIPISLSYKPKNLQSFCGSPVSTIDLFPYKDYLAITGTNDSDASLGFAHEELYSTEHLEISKNYQSEGGIFLQPGFQITATAQKIFEAKIEGCVNE